MLSPEDTNAIKFCNFVLGQSLSSVCHDPRAPLPSEWTAAELIPPTLGSPVASNLQFTSYIDKMTEPYKLFLDSCESIKERTAGREELTKSGGMRSIVAKSNKCTGTKQNFVSKEVPEVFFNDNFSTSDMFLMNSEDNAASSPLQMQKLTHYLDLVEVDLVLQISTRSESFFEALTNMQDLHDEVGRSCRDIDEIRSGMQEVDEEVVKRSLSVSKLCIKRMHLMEVYRKLQMIATVRQTQPTIQVLLAKCDYGTALDLIQSTQQVLAQDLLGVHSFKHMGLQLKEMVVLIEKMMQAEFVQFAVGAGSANELTPVEDRLLPLVLGLLRLNKLHVALDEYQASLIADLKTLVRREVTNIVSGRPEHEVRVLTWNDVKYQMSKQSSVEFLAVVKALFIWLEKKLNSVKQVHGIILSVIEEQKPSAEYRQQVVVASGEVVYAICEEAEQRVARMLRARSEQNARIAVGDFATLFSTCIGFVGTVETIAGRQCYGLRPTVLAQAKQFLDTFHSNRLSSLALLLENEDWTQAQVVSEFQQIATQLCMPPTPPVPEGGTLHPLDPSSPSSPSHPLVDARVDTGQADTITVDGEQYNVVNTTLMLLKILQDYITCMASLPALSADIVHRVIELLQLFNSRTCQLVLGAGARQLMKLKTITAKHLALASQCLGLVIKLIPNLRVHLAAHLPSKHHVLLADLDRVMQDYTNHRAEIFAKFVVIMKERLQTLGTTIDYRDEAAPSPSTPISALVKDTVTLHRFLAALLPPDQLQPVFTRIFSMFNTHLIDYFGKLDLSSRGSKKRLQADIIFLLTSLRRLSLVDDPGPALEDWFNKNFPQLATTV